MRTLIRGTDRLFHTTTDSFLVVECGGCRLLRLYPPPKPAELSKYYPPDYWFDAETDTSGRFAEFYRRFVLQDHVRFVVRALKDSGVAGPVLDVGCGGGLFLAMLEERGYPVVGLDFAREAAVRAARVHGIPAICTSMARPPFRPGSFAAITLFHVLEHLYDPASYLDQARKLLKPEGRLVVQVPNAACWQFLLFGEHWNGVDIPRHLFHFRARDLQVLLEDCGFEVLKEKHFSLRDNPAGLATTLAPSLDPMGRRVRRADQTPRQRLLRDIAYFGLVLASVPFTLLEAACRQGSTIMMEARKRP